MAKLADDWRPKPRILHPWPNQRFAVKHTRYRSRVREFRSHGSVRGAVSNDRSYREQQAFDDCAIDALATGCGESVG